MTVNGSRIYIVKDGMDVIGLVRAKSQAQAVHHCTAGRFGATVAGQDELIAAIGDGMSGGNMTPNRIADMIRANVRAMESGLITWEQFSRVNAATWDLASGGSVPVIGSIESRCVQAVGKALERK